MRDFANVRFGKAALQHQLSWQTAAMGRSRPTTMFGRPDFTKDASCVSRSFGQGAAKVDSPPLLRHGGRQAKAYAMSAMGDSGRPRKP